MRDLLISGILTMVHELRHNIRESMQARSTEELTQIWENNGRDTWSDSVFEIIKEILIDRGIELPTRGAHSSEPLITRSIFPLEITIELAPRLSRLEAAFMDGLLFTGPLLLGIAALSQSGGLSVLIGFLGLLSVPAVLGIQIYLLGTQGQTLGKRKVGIRIVKAGTGGKAGFVRNVLLRSVLNSILCVIPLYGIIDILFIFTSDRRCIHDIIAGTIVINQETQNSAEHGM